MNKWIKNENIISTFNSLLNMFQSWLHARSRGNMIVCLSIILKRTEVPRTRAAVTVRVQVKARCVVS